MHADASSRKPLTAQSFATQVTVINKAEIELGEMALKSSKDAEVQKFAQRMIDDHTSADKQLKSIAAKQNLDLPRQLDAEHQALKDKLAKLKGDEFDREYTKAMAEGHDKATKLFEQASRDPQLPGELKQFATTTLPTIKEHREAAHSVKGGGSHSHSDNKRS
jgi:putative membrane protein